MKTTKPWVSLQTNAFLGGLPGEIDTELPIPVCSMVANQDSTVASLPPKKERCLQSLRRHAKRLYNKTPSKSELFCYSNFSRYTCVWFACHRPLTSHPCVAVQGFVTSLLEIPSLT